MNYQNLHKILTACLLLAPKQDVRYYLCGVHIVQNDSDITFEATDGHRCIQIKSDTRIDGAGEFDIILDYVHVKLLTDKIKAMSYNKTDLYKVGIVSVGENLCLDLGDYKLIEGRYPDLNKILWGVSESKPIDYIGLDARYLSDLAKITKPFCKEKYQPVKLSFKSAMDSVRVDFTTNIEKTEATILIMPCRL